MAKTNYRTWTTGEVVTASMMNQQIRDNGNAIWVGTTAGDLDYYSDSTNKARIPIGSSNDQLMAIGGVPAWGRNAVFFIGNRGNTSWDGDNKSTGSTTIVANTFNSDVPADAKAVIVQLTCKFPVGADAGSFVKVGADASQNCLICRPYESSGNYFYDAYGVVPLTSGHEMIIGVNETHGNVSVDLKICGYFL